MNRLVVIFALVFVIAVALVYGSAGFSEPLSSYELEDYPSTYDIIPERYKIVKNAGHEVVGVRGFAGEISEAQRRESRKSNSVDPKFTGGNLRANSYATSISVRK